MSAEMTHPAANENAPGDPRGSSRRRYRELHLLVLATIVSLIVMSLGVNLFIFKQMRAARTQLAISRSVEQELANQYQLKEPAMRRFVVALQAFAVTHPDFQPILLRYRAGLPQFFTDVNPSTRPPARPPVATAPPAPASR